MIDVTDHMKICCVNYCDYFVICRQDVRDVAEKKIMTWNPSMGVQVML